MAFLARPSARIYYEVSGAQGPWLTLLGGHTRSTADFKNFARLGERQGYRVLLLDARGSGQTTAAPGFTLGDMADDVSALWASLGIASSHLVGFSMGGMIAQVVAVRDPSKLVSLALVSTLASRQYMLAKDEGDWPADLAALVDKLQLYVSPRARQANRLLLEAMAKQILASLQQGAFVAGSRAQRLAMAQHRPEELPLEVVTCPCLLLHGEDDAVIAAEAARDLKRRLPQATLEVYPGIGHLLLAEMPQLLQQRLSEFWQSSAG